jgi:hypothetical protein
MVCFYNWETKFDKYINYNYFSNKIDYLFQANFT